MYMYKEPSSQRHQKISVKIGEIVSYAKSRMDEKLKTASRYTYIEITDVLRRLTNG